MNVHSFGFINTCRDYYHNSTDAPSNFSDVASIQLLGHAMGYGTVNSIRPEEVHHNMYVLLLGESTITRKTTIQRLSKKIYPLERQLPFETSPEQFFTEMSKNPEAIQFLGEFSSLLKGITQGGYMSRFVEYYNEFHECSPILRRTIREKKGQETDWTINKGYLSLLSTTTPEMLKKFITEELTVGGFLPRWLLVKGEPNVKPRERLHPDVIKWHETLRNILNAVSSMKKDVKFVLSDEALKRYNEIEKDVYKNYSIAKAFVGRYLNYIVSIADILMVDDGIGRVMEQGGINRFNSLRELFPLNPVEVEVPAKYVDEAWKIIQPCLECAKEVVDYVLYDKSIAKLQDCVKRFKRITRSEAMRRTHLSADRMDISIRTLVEADLIEQEVGTVVRKRRGEIPCVWLKWVGDEDES